MGEGSGGANTADSYIGSLISLTSKSEIRYEGILYTVDTENSNIALQNVRSFGTEGRKKDGLPIYASDKVYDYIIFRGSDIKDLQVKSSPSLQPPPQPVSDPAIISLQSQYSQPAALPPAYAQPQLGPQDAPPQLPYPALPPSAFRGGVPQMYQPAAGLGSWGPPPPTGPNGNLAMPMYWPGYYRPPPGGQPLLQQQMTPHLPPALPQPPLPQPPAVQQVAPLSTPPLNSSNTIPQSTAQIQQVGGSLPGNTSLSATAPAVTSVPVSNAFQAVPVSSPDSVLDAAPASVAPSVPPSAAVSSPSSVQGVSAVITPAAKNPRRIVGSVQPSIPHIQSSAGISSTLAASLTTISVTQQSQMASVALPGLQPLSGNTGAANSVKQDQKVAESVKDQSAPTPTPKQLTQPLLPLPTSSTSQKISHQGSGSNGHSYPRRGRGRGGGSGRGIGLAQPTQQFSEDFDFTAMNEKFNKDEVWGKLGGKCDLREKVADGDEGEVVDGSADDEVTDAPQKSSSDAKTPVYVKDEFFDTLSCDALDREGRAERTKFSEQRKIDTETFGNFPMRSRGGRRGGRRGGFRGGYYGGGYMGGRNNGYGRGRGLSRPATAIN